MDSAIEKWFDLDETGSPRDILNPRNNFWSQSSALLDQQLDLGLNGDLWNEVCGFRIAGENINNTMSKINRNLHIVQGTKSTYASWRQSRTTIMSSKTWSIHSQSSNWSLLKILSNRIKSIKMRSQVTNH